MFYNRNDIFISKDRKTRWGRCKDNGVNSKRHKEAGGDVHGGRMDNLVHHRNKR